MRSETDTRQPGASSWPASDLRFIGSCPLCGSSASQALYERLVDRNFSSAPGKWNLRRCTDCGLARLDPRPSDETIGVAYASYYTHSSPIPPELSSVQRLRQALTHGYLNGQFGYNFSPAFRLGRYILPLFPARHRRAVRRIRHLPKPGKTARLLDVGCGDGGFLLEMRKGGWIVEGVDPDPRAVEVARATGLDIRQGAFPLREFDSDRFEAVTLNHVLEHLPNPLGALREVFRVLKPGGLLSITTPNLRSAGHRRFGRHWLHLDPPRHLAIFDPRTLASALERCGFSVREVAPHPLTRWTYTASAAVAAGLDPFDADFVPPTTLRLQARLASARATVRRAAAEELAVVARKPDSGSS